MIVVKVELWPMGIESKAKCLGKAEIGLERITPDHKIGDYNYKLLKMGRPLKNTMRHSKSDVWKEGAVEGHDRVRRGPWDLLYRVLHNAVSDRNKDIQ